ncbi:glycosyltransferase family 4 protein [Halobaculum magnesiiphilum]|uniref:Glycosyltransferase family 4 protein n=1 Tax=Halobaculum magnesiiphilum TaxID=1017351 RepID=A0A8T8WEG3_9EURY|nr:glycosyltransferase family 4 protein [Halobaculum magnesiiphilum]QZP38249.1 glycosyltransferase family 4 protein [Halobaculum magnesiiphilum]
MVQDDWWPRTGGGPVHVKELAIALAENHDCTVDIYTRALAKDGERHTDTEQYASGDVTVYRVSPCTEYWNPVGRISSMLTPIPKLVRGDYDVIHGHTFLPAVPTRLSGALSGSSTVFTVHGTALTSGVGRDESALAGVKRRIEKQFVLGFDYDSVISVNHEHVDLLETGHEDVRAIPNGVDLDRFDVDADRTQDVLFLGRLAPKKRVTDLIDAFARVEDEFPDSTLRIVGTGPKREELEAQVQELGISDRVSFEGRVPDEAIPEYYATAGAFVLPSVWEGHPLTLLEAWAASAPVIASSVEGIEEFVDHGKTGYLVPAKSPGELADALRTTLENPEVARKWGENARQLVEDEYSWEGVAERTYSLYQDLA